MSTIKLALVDDETLFREGLKLAISSLKEIEIMMEARDGRVFLDTLKDATEFPEIVLLDLKMPHLNGVETAKVLAKQYPDLKVIVLSTYFSEAFVYNMIELGAAAYLSKNIILQEVEHTIRSVSEKGFYYDNKVLEILKQGAHGKAKESKTSYAPRVTTREKEVLQLICEQYTNNEIAEKLLISGRTVDGHRMNLLQKFGCRNTAGLVAFALQQQLVRVDPTQFWR